MDGRRKENEVADNLNSRVATLEESMRRAFAAIEALADKQAKLDDALATLLDAQIRLQEEQIKTEQRFQQTEQRFQQTEQRFQQTDERFRQTDERIAKLVIAMGEFLRRTDTPR
jgi:chromosome segregation ATPase